MTCSDFIIVSFFLNQYSLLHYRDISNIILFLSIYQKQKNSSKIYCIEDNFQLMACHLEKKIYKDSKNTDSNGAYGLI